MMKLAQKLAVAFGTLMALIAFVSIVLMVVAIWVVCAPDSRPEAEQAGWWGVPSFVTFCVSAALSASCCALFLDLEARKLKENND